MIIIIMMSMPTMTLSVDAKKNDNRAYEHTYLTLQ